MHRWCTAGAPLVLRVPASFGSAVAGGCRNETRAARLILLRRAAAQARVAEVYHDVSAMRDAARIQFQTTVPALVDPNEALAPHWRMVWHFAGTARVGEVLDPRDFSVRGTRGLHVADMSACRVTADGGTMAMAYLTGHLAATRMRAAKAGSDGSKRWQGWVVGG